MIWRIILLIIAVVLLALNLRKQFLERKEYSGFEGNQIAFFIGVFIAFSLNCFLSWYVIDFFINLMR